MSDARSPEPAVPATPADPVAAPPAPVQAAPVQHAPAADPVQPAPPAPARKGRGVGVWSFILGLLAVLADVGFLVYVVVALTSFANDLGEGASLAIAGFLLAALVFWGGFVVAGLGALLGIIALITGRGRVIGFIGLLLSAAVLVVHTLLATGVLSGLDSLGGIGG